MKLDIEIYRDLFSEPTVHDMINLTPWEQSSIHIYGRDVKEPRLTAYYGDLSYTYSSTKRTPLIWEPHILNLKSIVESYTNIEFNSCLLNYYRDGNDYIGFHSDDEPELGENPNIATLVLGEARNFIFIEKSTNVETLVMLGHGDLLLMKGDTQKYYKHGIKKSKYNIHPRVSLTFRRIYDGC